MGSPRNFRPRIGVAFLLVSATAGCALASSGPAGNSDVRAEGPSRMASPLVADGAEDLYHPAQVLVRFGPGATAEQVRAAHLAAGAMKTLRSYTLVPGLECVEVPLNGAPAAVAAYRASPGVMYAELDYWRHAMAQSTPYGITLVAAPAVWAGSTSAGRRGGGARVAVLDTGVDLAHEDLPVPVAMQSFISGQAVDDFNDHGTHCSGTVLARDNDLGVIGVAPEADLMIAKVLSNGGSGASSGVMAGAEWAAANGANVISMSLGGGGFSQAEADVYAAAEAANVLVVAAAGNSNSSDPSYPAAYDAVMSVAAVDANRNRAGFSNFGPLIDIAAPGVSVESTIPHLTEQNVSTASWDGVARSSAIVGGSGQGSATGAAIFCGVGNPADFPPEVSGNIAHIRRRGVSAATGSTLTFREKTENAIAAGATAVIVSNDNGGVFNGTLNTDVSIPVVAISQEDGDALQAISGVQATVSVAQGQVTRADPYAFFSGTSMACPHVAGVAGLLVGVYGPSNITVAQLKQALIDTAEDLGEPGRDDQFGAGLVRADLAKARLDTIITPRCPADFNSDGNADPDDLSDYIACYFGTPACDRADFNADSNVDPDDLSDFISAYFGC